MAGLAIVVLATTLAPMTAGAAVSRSGSMRTIVYHGARLTVPARWPVIDLARHPDRCVRFDRHAVYLGRPGDEQRCPASAAGRTEALLVTPVGHGGSIAGAAGSVLPASAAGGSSATAGQLIERQHEIVITATWDHAPRLIRHALGIASLATLTRHAARPQPQMTFDSRRNVTRTPSARIAVASTPGGVFTGSGFDACSTPNTAQMSAWGSSPYRAIGVYIGGENMACSQPNLTPAWVSAQSAAGWHLVPIFVGLQAPSNSCGCASIASSSAASEGTGDAEQAVADAQAIGLGTGNPLYLDMEAYNPTSTNTNAVLAFINAWTTQLHASGYRSGVYSSDGSGVRDLVNRYGAGFAEPDDIWIANWNGSQSTADTSVPAQDWASHQRLHQYEGAHNETYSGVTINIDGDYLDAATAAAGSSGAPASTGSAPTLKVAAAPTGSLELTPAWSGASGVQTWQVVGGQDPSTSTWAASPVSAGRVPIVVPNAYSYFSVRALGVGGQLLGSSPAVASPNHLALYGQSVFVPSRGLMGIPVGCFDSAGCTLTTAVTLGRQTLALTGPEHLSDGGGLIYAALTPAARTLLARAPAHRFTAQIAVRDTSGMTVTRAMRLTLFTTSGRTTGRTLSPSPAVRLLGTADFVSNGWVGGILVQCTAVVPCSATSSLVAQGQTIASGHAQSLGVGQTGYLMFTLTPAGHRLLAAASGNQLSTSVTVTNLTAGSAGSSSTSSGGGASSIGGSSPGTSSVARGHIALIAY